MNFAPPAKLLGMHRLKITARTVGQSAFPSDDRKLVCIMGKNYLLSREDKDEISPEEMLDVDCSCKTVVPGGTVAL